MDGGWKREEVGELEKEREGGFGLVCKLKNIFLNKKYEERRKKFKKYIISSKKEKPMQAKGSSTSNMEKRVGCLLPLYQSKSECQLLTALRWRKSTF